MVDTDRSDNWGGPRDGSGRPPDDLLRKIRLGTFNAKRSTHRELLLRDKALFGLLRDPADPQGRVVNALIDCQVSYEIAADPWDDRIPLAAALDMAKGFAHYALFLKGATFPFSSGFREWTDADGEEGYADAPLWTVVVEELEQESDEYPDFETIYARVNAYLEGTQPIPADVRKHVLRLDAEQRAAGYDGP